MNKVILFKSHSEDYEKAFTDNNYHPIFIEPLQFDFVNTEELRGKLLQDDYTGLILTSPRAIEAVSQCWDPSRFVIWNAKKVYTVGDASRYKVKLLLGLDALGATSGNAENLSKLILNENGETSKFLFPCGSLRSEILPTMLQTKGITVDSLTVYETNENDNLQTRLMEIDNKEDMPCCLVFFSPSGCEYTHRQLQTFGNRLGSLPRFAIGNSTAHKIETLGFEIAGVAAKPDAQSIVEAIQTFFSSEGSTS